MKQYDDVPFEKWHVMPTIKELKAKVCFFKIIIFSQKPESVFQAKFSMKKGNRGIQD